MLKDQAGIDESVRLFKSRATHPMNPVAKKALLEALRSGEFAQTNGYLHVTEDLPYNKAGFCCLGVLSKVALENGVDVKCAPSGHDSKVMEYFTPKDGVKYDQSTAFLIQSVAQWADFPAEVDSSLMGINDNGGSFELIADLIEEHL